MSNKKDNVVAMDFGTTEPRITETTEKEMLAQEQVNEMCLSVGRSTLEWAMFATKEEFVQHMVELYDAFHKEEVEENEN